MKKIFSFLLISFFSFSLSFSQVDNSVCGSTSFPWIDSISNIPFYLRPGFGDTINFNIAIIFVDFPDGRVNGTEQVFDINQLIQIVPNGGNLDAVAELGIDSSNGIWNYVPAKYTYSDRWNMIFSTGYYYGNVHPDYHSHRSIGYGSLKEYFNETTTRHIRLIPALTHSEHSNDSILGYGIINRDTLLNGKRYIKNVMLGKRKFGDSSVNSFFRGPGSQIEHSELKDSTLSALARLHASGDIEFNPTNFDGEILIVFAGGSGGIGGQAFTTSLTARGTYLHYKNDIADSNIFAKMDGIHILAHEMGHNPPFNFSHTNSGRYCVMNPTSTASHCDCPPHFNPAFKIMKGWANPIEYRHNQTITDLPPVEINNRIGIVTIYGKPSAVPDWQTGEYFILENRRLLGFDKKINDYPGFASDTSFKGGMLIWHYSPYGAISGNLCGLYQGIKLEFPTTPLTDICINYANSSHFFGYNGDPEYHKLDSSRTYSSFNLRTGIIIDSITQQQTTTSDVSFKINYTIHEPPNYSYVICGYNSASNITNLSDTVYVHNNQTNSVFHTDPGTVFESIRTSFSLDGIKANGTSKKNIIFKGAGYSNYRIIPKTISFNTNQIDDSLVLSYCDFNTLDTNSIINCFCSSNIPTKIVNINIIDTSKHLKLIGGNSEQSNGNLSKFDNNTMGNLDILNYWKFYLENDFTIGTSTNLNILDKGNNFLTKIEFIYPYNIICNGLFNLNSDLTINRNINISSTGRFKFYVADLTNSVSLKFAPGSGLNCNGELYASGNNNFMSPKYVNFDRDGNTEYWNGIICYNPSNVYINGSKINNASTGITVSHASSYTVNIVNSEFDSNKFSDIKLDYMNDSDVPGYIANNVFYGTSTQVFNLGLDDVSTMNIDSNIFNNVYNVGISLLYCSNPKVAENKIYASTNMGATPLSGIHCYNTFGFFGCNLATNFYNGILLDNSSPYFLNNDIYNNGYGMYLTNNSNPILSPSYSQNQSLYLAGYNKIYNNLSDEIYCDNQESQQLSLPYVMKGYNSIYDNTYSGYLINLNYELDPPLEAQNNYWGGTPNNGMFSPDGSVDYSEYLSSAPSYANCLPSISNEDNSSMSQDILLLGSANLSDYNKNYNSASNSYKQYISSNNNVKKDQLIIAKLFNTHKKSGSNFAELNNYLINLANQHLSDTALSKYASFLSIGSNVEQSLYQQAINEYQSIINSSQIPYEIYYANIEKLRTITLMLDTLLNPGGGDNPVNLSPEQLSNLIYSSIISKTQNSKQDLTFTSKKQFNKGDKTGKSENNKGNNKSDNYTITENNNHLDLKQNNFNKLKDLLIPKNIKLSNLSNPELVNLFENVVAVNLFEQSLLYYTPPSRPLNRVESKYLVRNNLENGNLPKVYKLSQNYPNPFNPVTKINFDLPKEGNVKLVIYDILGREVKQLVNEFKKAGKYTVEFNGNNLASGIYFYRIEIGNFVQVKKMMLIK